MAATAPKISAMGLDPSWPAPPVGAPCAAVCVPEAAPVALVAALVALVAADRVAVETVLLLLPVEAAETEDTADAVLLLDTVRERTDWLTEAADALDEAEAETAEEMADGLPPLRVNWPE